MVWESTASLCVALVVSLYSAWLSHLSSLKDVRLCSSMYTSVRAFTTCAKASGSLLLCVCVCPLLI